MIKRMVKGCMTVLAVVMLLAALGLAWLFHAHRGGGEWMTNPSSIDEATWRKALEEPAKAQTTLKVLTWNIQMLPSVLGPVVPPLSRLQHERAPWIVDYLKAQSYDVICFQEVFDQKALAVLLDGLKSTYPYAVYPQYASPWRAISNGVLFVSRVPIRYVAHVSYPNLRRVDWFSSKGCCLIEGVKEGQRFQMAGTHFPVGQQRVKDGSVAAIHNTLLPLRQTHVPFIALGDFNTRKGSPEYDALLASLEVKDNPIDDPRPFTSDPENSWKGTFKHLGLIDHVLLNPNGTGTIFGRSTIQRARHEYKGKTIDLSDHFGLVSEIVLRNSLLYTEDTTPSRQNSGPSTQARL